MSGFQAAQAIYDDNDRDHRRAEHQHLDKIRGHVAARNRLAGKKRIERTKDRGQQGSQRHDKQNKPTGKLHLGLTFAMTLHPWVKFASAICRVRVANAPTVPMSDSQRHRTTSASLYRQPIWVTQERPYENSRQL